MDKITNNWERKLMEINLPRKVKKLDEYMGQTMGGYALLDRSIREKATKPNIDEESTETKLGYMNMIDHYQKEFQGVNQFLTLTINPKKINYQTKVRYTYNWSRAVVCKAIINLSRKDQNCKAIFFPELTQNGMIHWHGIVKTSPMFHATMMAYLRRKMGFIYISSPNSLHNKSINEIKLMSDPVEKWLIYSSKNYIEMLKMEFPKISKI